MNLHFLALRR